MRCTFLQDINLEYFIILSGTDTAQPFQSHMASFLFVTVKTVHACPNFQTLIVNVEVEK